MKKIVVFDLETTGLSSDKDQIIQFAGIKIDRDTNKTIETLNLMIQPVGNYNISIQAYMKHGIKPDMLRDKPYFHDVADKIVEFFEDTTVDVLTYNGNSFDIQFLQKALNRLNKNIDFVNRNCYDAFIEEKRRNGISLENTYKRYSGKTMEEAGLTAHDALSDVKATYSVFYAQQKNEPYEPEFMIGEDGFLTQQEFKGKQEVCFNVGKYKNLPISYIAGIDQGYLNWAVSDKSSICENSKNYIKKFIK